MKLDLLKDKNGKLHYPSLLYAITCIWPACGFLPAFPSVLVYVFPILYAAYCITRQQKANKLMLLLVAYIPLELLIAQPSPVFKSWPRYVLFLLLMMNVSPLFDGKALRSYRENIFRITMYACAFLAVGSFFARFLGINFMQTIYEFEGFQTGAFGGLTPQSMMLGPIAGIAACYLASMAYKSKRKLDWVLVVMALFAVMFSASRSALMATIAGVVVTIYRQSGSASKFVQIGIVSFVIAASTFSFWGSALDNVMEKNGGAGGLNVDSREALWIARLADFQESPVFGVGFCAAAHYDYGVDDDSGRFESGTSWLIILSMLGIVGACIIVPILFKAFFNAYKSKTELSAVACGVLALFFIHMFAEGYIFAGGSFLAFMLWLTIGVATDCKYKKEE